MREVSSTAAASAMNLNNLINSFSVGFIPLENSVKVVEMAMTEAGSKISAGEFASAMKDVEGTLRHFGATEKEINKFTESTKGVHHLQSKFKSLFGTKFKQRLESGDIKADPTSLKDEMEKVLLTELKDAGFSKAMQDQFKDIFGGMDVKDLNMKEILAGEFQSMAGAFEGMGEEAMKKMMAITKARIEMEKKMISLTQQNHIAVQKQAIDMQMEAAQIIAKHGGAAFDNANKRSMLLERANVGAGRLGVGNLTSGSTGDLRQRNLQINSQFSQAEMQRRQKGGMAGAAGVEADAVQKDLIKANKEHAKLIRDLIRLEEDELKIIQQKNALEKQSLEALAKGDLESFLKQQAAVGATAAVATGDQRLMNLFGADALSGAFDNIKAQQESGVQSLFGRRLAGAGGLTEQAAGASLASRGLDDLRSTQVMAGTTPAEEAQRRKIRGLAGQLGETGEMASDMAEMQVGTATIRITTATIEADRLASGQRAEAERQNVIDAAHPALGGLIGSNGVVYRAFGGSIFKPKGTDTVPAMLTPGEFVVRREAVTRGNNLRMLRAMNSGSTGTSSDRAGGYYHGGDLVGAGGSSVGLDPSVVNNLASSLTQFNTNLADNIRKLENLKFQIKLEPTSINVNLNGTSFLSQLKDNIKKELLTEVAKRIGNSNFNSAGDLAENNGVLNTA